jgi:hypothetical protein
VAGFVNANKCSYYPEFESDISVSSTSNSFGVISVIASNGPLKGDNGEPGGHCLMGQLTYEQFQNLQDERLKAAIIRSLNSNSSWQQR